jgi:propionyl-CoA carboxylase alpha chain
VDACSTRGQLRLDSGVVDGEEVSAHYDPMLAKLVARAPTREQAARRLAAARPARPCTA